MIWLRVIRAPFLLLSVVLVIYGSGVSYYEGYWNIADSLIALLGLLSLHIAVNVFNEYYDFITGIDINTIKTEFNGGSGVLPSGLIVPEVVYRVGLSAFAVGACVGIYFLSTKGARLIPILVIGAICVLFYTPGFTRLLVGELAAGLGLGVLPVLGTYFVLTGGYSIQAIIASIPAGLLTFNLLLLSEIPDYHADKAGGRKNIVIVFGRKKAILLYSMLVAFVYIYVGIFILTGLMPVSVAIALLTIPLAVRAINIAKSNYDNPVGLTDALRMNVMLVLGTQLLIAVGYFIG